VFKPNESYYKTDHRIGHRLLLREMKITGDPRLENGGAFFEEVEKFRSQ
jgi:hypothetical protein